MFLLDTPVVVELRNARAGKGDAGVAQWAASVRTETLFLSAISLMELYHGVNAETDRVQAARLHNWLDSQVIPAFEGRILPVDVAVITRRAKMNFPHPHQDREAILAATSSVHHLTLVTRHSAPYRNGRVKLFNPWGFTPEETPAELDWQDALPSGTHWLKNPFVRA